MQYLDIDAQLVHVVQPQRHVIQFPGRLGGGHVSIGFEGQLFQLLFAQIGEAEASAGAVDGPHLTFGVIGVGQEHGAELLLRGF